MGNRLNPLAAMADSVLVPAGLTAAQNWDVHVETTNANGRISELLGDIEGSLSGEDGLVANAMMRHGLDQDPKFEASADGSSVFSATLDDGRTIMYRILPVVYKRAE